ncbi:MAG: glycosyltransferase [Candidatus Omnitrophica bacterium]|nr:glycosyltransferase [Candidatus Omnitrophota bacterium]
MLRNMEDYIDIVGAETIATIYKKASKLYGRHLININSTFQGGGVAEILSRLVPMMNNVGVDTGWRILHGNPTFFEITKKFHNALQSGDINLTAMKKKIYLEVNQEFAIYTHFNHDCVILHDPQPLPLVKYSHKRQPWVWRCHIDLSNPNKELWEFLKQFILRYDLVIFSSEDYKKADLPVEQKVIHPAIDPLALKNRDLSKADILKYVTKAGIPTDKPIISQISRMDPWKDPEGVLDVFDYVKKQVDCRLVFCYNLASDDPEGMEIYSRVYKKAEDWVKRGDVFFVVGNNDILVNAIQRFSSVILQKSIREGFSLTVTEALWKARPVVASNVGAIPVQVIDRQTGFLVEATDYKGCADRVVELLKKPALAERIGKQAKEHVRQNFLTTRLLLDYLNIVGDLVK